MRNASHDVCASIRIIRDSEQDGPLARRDGLDVSVECMLSRSMELFTVLFALRIDKSVELLCMSHA